MGLPECVRAATAAFTEYGMNSVHVAELVDIILTQANRVDEAALHTTELRIKSIAQRNIEAKKAGHVAFDNTVDGTINRLLALQKRMEIDAQLEADSKRRSAILNTKVWAREDAIMAELMTGIHKLSGKPVTAGEAMTYRQLGTPERIFNEKGEIVKGTRNGIGPQQSALRHKYLGDLEKALDAQDLVKEFRSGKHNPDIEIEKWYMKTYGEVKQQGTNDVAFKIAKIIYKIETDMSALENSVGGVSRLNGSSGIKNIHNRERILSGHRGNVEEAKAAWKAFILPRIDKAKTFAEVVNEDMKMEQWFDNIISHEHGEDHKIPTGDETGYARPGSLAKRRSADEDIFFLSGKDAWEYQEKFGAGSTQQQIMGDISRTTRDIVMLQRYGTDPDRMHRMMMDHYSKMARPQGTVKQREGLKNSFFLQHDAVFASQMGYLDSPPAGRATYIHRWMRNFQGLVGVSKLGAGWLSAIPDVAYSNATMHYHGIKGFDRLVAEGKAVFGFMGLAGKMTESDRLAAQAIGVGLDSFNGEMNTRLAFEGPGPGVISSMQQIEFKLNGMHRWNDRFKRVIGMTLSHHYAQQYKTKWADMPPKMKSVLEMYGFGEEHWKSIRQAAIVEAPDGTKFMDPAGLQKLTDAQTAMHLLPGEDIASEFNLARKRNELETQLRTMLTDQVDDAVITPGTRERMIATLGTQAGTPAGVLARLLTHFKSFPISVVTRSLMRDLHGQDTFGQGVMGSVRTIAVATVGGYLSMSIKDALKGKTPRPFMKADGSFNHDVLRDSVIRGGALGLYGDVILTEYDRAFNDPASVHSGPSVGTAFDIFGLGARSVTGLITGENTPAASEYLNTTINTLPFQNLYYVRPVLDFLIINQINELLDPGYSNNLERKARKHEQEKLDVPVFGLGENIWD